MKGRTRVLLAGIGSTLLSLIFYLSTIMGKDGLIIRHHYSGWRTMTTIATVLLAISGTLLALCLFVIVYSMLRNKRQMRLEQEQKMEREARMRESKKLRNPEDVRQFFVQICDEKPHCQIAKLILGQLDKMNEHQNNFDNLKEKNDISTVADNIAQALQEAEDSICEDCKSAINRYIVGDEAGFETIGKMVYERNEHTLEKVQEFLSEVAAFVSSKGRGDEAVANLELYAQRMNDAKSEEGF